MGCHLLSASYIVYFSIIISMFTIVICHVERLEATSQLKYAAHLCGHKKLNKPDDRKKFQFWKRGIGIESEKYAEIKKYGNKLKMELSDHRTKR